MQNFPRESPSFAGARMVFHLALCCFKCRTFQVTQEKKTRPGATMKWTCKLCRERQSVKKVYGRAPKASLLRPAVQEYNMRRGHMEGQADGFQSALAAQDPPLEWEHLLEGEEEEEEAAPLEVADWEHLLVDDEEEGEGASSSEDCSLIFERPAPARRARKDSNKVEKREREEKENALEAPSKRPVARQQQQQQQQQDDEDDFLMFGHPDESHFEVVDDDEVM